jgi:hypothetical protein
MAELYEIIFVELDWLRIMFCNDDCVTIQSRRKFQNTEWLSATGRIYCSMFAR